MNNTTPQITNNPSKISSTPVVKNKKKRPVSHKVVKNKTSQKGQQQLTKHKQIASTTNGSEQKVIFKLKKNQVDKFYCPELVKAKLTKSGPIDLESIPELPDISEKDLLGIH